MSKDIRKLTKLQSRQLRQMARTYAVKRVGLLIAGAVIVALVANWLGVPFGEAIGMTILASVVFYTIVLMPSITHFVDWRETEGWYQDILWGGRQPD